MIKTRLIIIVSLILLVSGGFIALDLVAIPSLFPKGITVLLTSLLVFLIRDDGLSKGDTKLLKVIYLLIIMADISLVLFDKAYGGIIIFFLFNAF